MPSMADSTLGHVLLAEDDRGVRESLVRALKIDRTRKMCAFLTKGVKLPIERTNEDGRVLG